jgi:hypothetical protein
VIPAKRGKKSWRVRGVRAIMRRAFSRRISRNAALIESVFPPVKRICNLGGHMPQYSLMDVKGPKRKLVIVRSAITVVVLLLLCYSATRSTNILSAAAASTRTHRTYTTHFPLTENPISEGGKWTNGQKDGLDWADARTTPGFAFGTEIGGKRPEPQMYDDTAALLTGTWAPDQTAEAKVRSVNRSDKIWEEVELRLRSAISPHKCTGYEVMFRCSKSPKAYCNIAKWNGPLGSFSYLKKSEGSRYGVANGDVVKASIIGNVITVYINGVQILQATDNTFKTGNPGIGFFIDGATGVNADFGFSSFTATEN